MRKIVLFLTLLLFLLFSSSAFCLNTYYDNQTGYNNAGGYNNNIPYAAFFYGEHAPKAEQIKVQKVTKSGQNVQAVIPVNTPEEEIEQQTIEE
jgi:hypothetical protein